MRAIAWLLRVFCYVFHTILSLAMLALGTLAVQSNVTDMKLETLPWSGVELNHWLIGLGLTGLLCVVLAVTGKVRFLLALWAILALGMIVRGVFFNSAVTFSGREDFHNWLLLVSGAVLAALGSLSLLGRRNAY
jgi:hypothetical protein